MQESKPLVSVTNRSECHLESTILVWVSFRSIRDKIGPWRACCALAMGRDQNRVNLVDAGRCWSMVLARGQDASGDRQGIVRMSSGCRQDVVRMSSECRQGIVWMDGCVFGRVGVIVDSAGISGPATGSVNSFPFVGSGSGGGGWLMRRYAPPICIADMHCRYALPIWCDDMQGRKQKRPRAIRSWP